MLLLLGALSSAALAQDDVAVGNGLTEYSISAFGVNFQNAWVTPDYGLGCLGLEGFTADGFLRTGAEGHVCGHGGNNMFDIGPQAGLSIRPGPFFLSALGEVGLGWSNFGLLNDSSAWLFLKPRLGIGVGAGFFGVELSGYTQVALPFDGSDAFTISGGQLALLFGDFYGPDHVRHHPAPAPHRYYWWHRRGPGPHPRRW
jgi:hypothetical protein